jgi:hypothetical protein
MNCLNLTYPRRGLVRKSKKRIFYIFQMLDFMTQFALNEFITDVRVQNKLHAEICERNFPTWDDFELYWKPIHDTLFEKFKVGKKNVFL